MQTCRREPELRTGDADMTPGRPARAGATLLIVARR